MTIEERAQAIANDFVTPNIPDDLSREDARCRVEAAAVIASHQTFDAVLEFLRIGDLDREIFPDMDAVADLIEAEFRGNKS